MAHILRKVKHFTLFANTYFQQEENGAILIKNKVQGLQLSISLCLLYMKSIKKILLAS